MVFVRRRGRPPHPPTPDTPPTFAANGQRRPNGTEPRAASAHGASLDGRSRRAVVGPAAPPQTTGTLLRAVVCRLAGATYRARREPRSGRGRDSLARQVLRHHVVARWWPGTGTHPCRPPPRGRRTRPPRAALRPRPRSGLRTPLGLGHRRCRRGGGGGVQVESLAALLGLWVIAGAANAAGLVAFQTLMQERTTEGVRASVLAASESIMDVGCVAGVMAAAALGAALGVRAGLAVAGVMFGAAAMLGERSRRAPSRKPRAWRHRLVAALSGSALVDDVPSVTCKPWHLLW